MKKTIITTIFATVIIAAVSCKKEVTYLDNRTNTTENDALVKINYLSAYANNPGVQISINGVRVSGLITGRTPFPGGGYNTNGSNFPDYLKVAPGSNTISIAIPNKNASTDSVPLFSTTVTLSAKKNYTLHVTDTLTKTKGYLVEDDLSMVAFNTSFYRFVNMMPNVPLIDLYYGTTRMATGIPYGGSSAYFPMITTSAATSWAIRETGTSPTSTALATYSSTNTTLDQRVYTAFSLGYKGATATNTRPYISFLLNR